jgi:uncharacterized lipoprotein YbaY
MIGTRLPIIVLASALLFGCSKAEPAASVQASLADPVAALTKALDESMIAVDVQLLEVAKVEDTLTRQAAKLKGERVDRRLPEGPPEGAAIRNVLTAYARMHGLGAAQVKLGKANVGGPIPARLEGATPYPFERSQLIGTSPIAITVSSTDEERLKAFFKAMVTLQLPLMVLPTLLLDNEQATFSGSVYFRRKITPPKRALVTPTLADLAAGLGVSVPTGEPDLKTLTSLHAQLTSKQGAVHQVLLKQDRAAQNGRILQFLRNKAKEGASQPVPKLVRAAKAAEPKQPSQGGTTP